MTIITFAMTTVIIIADVLAKLFSRGNRCHICGDISKPINFKLNFATLFNFGAKTATVICFVGLFITAFYPMLIQKQSISKFFMMAHVTFGLVFAIAFTLVVMISIKQNKFSNSSQLLKKICFWISLPIIIATMGSIILCMFKLFSTQSQLLLTNIHRYSGLAISSLIIIYIYCTISELVQRGK